MKFIYLFIYITSLSVQAKVAESIIAIVNNEIITQSDINNFRKKLKTGGLVNQSLLGFYDMKKLIKSKESLINYLIDTKIVDSEVKRQNLSVTIERIEKEVRTIAKRNQISRSQLKAALKQKGIVFSQYQDFIKTNLERQSILEKEIISKIKISDDDISSYYISQSKGGKSRVFEYTLAHILFRTKNGGDKGAKQRAQRVYSKLNKDKDSSFESLAAKYSEDPNFTQGGLLGTFKAGEMLPSLEKAVQPLLVGKVSKVVKTKIGYHIIKVVKKNLITDPKLTQEKRKIAATLRSQAFKRQLENWLKIKKQESFIRIN